MNFLEGQPIKASRFSWAGGHGYSEWSDLHDLRLHQVWPDSCDGGFTILSERTGQTRTFVEHDRQTNREGECVGTTYVSVNEKTGRIDQPNMRLAITIYND
jgi:hypothetical protein